MRGRGIDAEDRFSEFIGDPLADDESRFPPFGDRGKDLLLAQEGQHVGIGPGDHVDDLLEG